MVMTAAPNIFAIKYFYRRSLKYRILTEDRSPILIVDDRTFKYFIRNGFVVENVVDGIRAYTLTEKATNYKFKKINNGK